ncbi:hypothetical protein DFH09DRAFT_1084730 [Mycena vulgaris]|nr:hypothetical protein DFH09DRAFT_1084730 [Mycena vulgaris]
MFNLAPTFEVAEYIIHMALTHQWKSSDLERVVASTTWLGFVHHEVTLSCRSYRRECSPPGSRVFLHVRARVLCPPFSPRLHLTAWSRTLQFVARVPSRTMERDHVATLDFCVMFLGKFFVWWNVYRAVPKPGPSASAETSRISTAAEKADYQPMPKRPKGVENMLKRSCKTAMNHVRVHSPPPPRFKDQSIDAHPARNIPASAQVDSSRARTVRDTVRKLLSEAREGNLQDTRSIQLGR